MTQDVVEQYDTFNNKGCPDEIIFGNFNEQPIPYNYYNLHNDDDDDDDGNIVSGNPIDNVLPDNE